MRALLYLKLHHWKNAIIRAFKTPSKLAQIVIYALLIVVMFALTVFKPSSTGLQTMNSDWPMRIAGAILALAFLFSVLAVKNGLKGVNHIFSEADAHILFASPFKPQSLLIYGLSNQILVGIFSSVFLLFQMANFANLGLNAAQIAVVFVAWILISLLSAQVRMLIYVLNERFALGRKLAQGYAFLIGLLTLGSALFLYIQGTHNVDELIRQWLELPWLRYFPLAGWLGVVCEGLFFGMLLEHWVCLVLLVVAVPLTFLFVYQKPIDFYEDAQIFKIVLDASGKMNAEQKKAVMSRVKPPKVRFTGIGHGYGANTLFYKQWTEARRSRRFFIGWGFALYLLVALGLILLQINSPGLERKWLPVIFVGLYLFARLMFNSLNPISRELTQAYFYLFPISALGRVFYGQLSTLIFLLIDILPGFAILVMVGQLNVLLAVLLLLMMVSSSMAANSAYLLSYAMVGRPDRGLNSLLLLFMSSMFLSPSLLGFTFMALMMGFGVSLWLCTLVVALAVVFNVGLAFAGVPCMKKVLAKGQDEEA